MIEKPRYCGPTPYPFNENWKQNTERTSPAWQEYTEVRALVARFLENAADPKRRDAVSGWLAHLQAVAKTQGAAESSRLNRLFCLIGKHESGAILYELGLRRKTSDASISEFSALACW